MIFFRKKFTVRRFSDVTVINGYQAAAYDEFEVVMNVQETQPNRMMPGDEGKSTGMSLSSYSDIPFRSSDDLRQSNPDILLYKGEWYECTSCNLFDNTILHHYNATWNRMPKGVDSR